MADCADERSPLLAGPLVDDAKKGASAVTCTEILGDDAAAPPVTEDAISRRTMLIMATVWVGVFLGALDSTIVATLSAPISSEFHSLQLLSWLGIAYVIANAVCQPVTGRLTDIFGRAPGLVISNILFASGNLICGMATSHTMLVAGRVVAGLGGGGLMSIPTFLSSDLLPLRKRGLAGGIANVWYGIGAMSGAVFGGLLHDRSSLGWRMAFLIQVPPSLLSAFLVYTMVDLPPKQSDKSYLARIDFLGVFLTAVFMVLFVLGLSPELSNSSLPPTMTIPLSILVLSVFIWWEYHALQPIIPIKLLLHRTVASCFIASFLCAMISMISIFYIPLFLQTMGFSVADAGLNMAPLSIGTISGALGTGFLMSRTGKYRAIMFCGTLGMLSGAVMFMLQGQGSSSWLIGTGIFCVGIGYNSIYTSTQVACVAAVDQSEQAVVSSLLYLARSLGSTCGIAISTAVYQKSLFAALWHRFSHKANASEEIARIMGSIDELQMLPHGWHDGVMGSFSKAFHAVWMLVFCATILAFISVTPVRQHVLHSTLSRTTPVRHPSYDTLSKPRVAFVGRKHEPHQPQLAQPVLAANKETRESLSPAVAELKQYILSTPRIRMCFTSMWEEVKWPENLVTPRVRDYEHMLELLNQVITRAPTFVEAAVGSDYFGTPMYGVLQYAARTPSGRIAFLDPVVNKLFCNILREWTTYLESPESTQVLCIQAEGWFAPGSLKYIVDKTNEPCGTDHSFEELFICDPSEPSYGFRSWDHFFTRQFQPSQRPVAEPDNDSIICNPCESAPYKVAHNAQLRDQFWIKSQPYSVLDILANCPLATAFDGATVYQAYLSATSYHRWHTPVSGTIVRAFVQDGTYFSEPETDGPKEHRMGANQSYLASLATRAVIFIQADNPEIGLIAFTAVGIVEISSCEITVTEGQRVQKGEQLGIFHYGGSTFCLLFRQGVRVGGLPEPGSSTNIAVCSQLAFVA